MMTRQKYQSGFTLPFVVMVALGLAILIYSVTRTTQMNTHHMLYFNNMNRVYRLAESGATATIGRLSNDSNLALVNGQQYTIQGEGEYESFARAVSSPTYGCYYIITSATRTAGGKDYSCKLHTYASIANVGEYFAAYQNEYIMSPGMDASGGKIYAPNITVLVDNLVPATARAESIEFVYVARAQNNRNLGEIWRSNVWLTDGINGVPIIPNEVQIGASGNDMPLQLSSLKKLPIVSDDDITRYTTQLGGNIHTVANMLAACPNGQIFPPGYVNGLDPLDQYVGHQNTNAHHVYYSAGNMSIGNPNADTTIHGQVLFVAAGNIEITGSILNAVTPNFPGEGNTSVHQDSSTAHQAIFITQNHIRLRAAELAPATATGIALQAFLYAPQGLLQVTERTAAPVLTLNFSFLGCQLLAGGAVAPENLPTQFTGTRTYAYNPTFRTNPPRWLPSVSHVLYAWEEITGTESLY